MKTFVVFALFVTAVSALPAGPSVNWSSRIVGGEDASEHQAPYIVTLQVDREAIGNFRHTCGGSIISPTWILSAAHCVTENGLDLDYQIIAGQHNLAVESGSEQIRRVTDIRIHADYAGGVAPFDIMVLGLESPLTIVAGIVESIKLPARDAIPEGNVQLFGWGSTSTTDNAVIPDILQTTVKPVLSLDLCREVLDQTYPLGTPLHFTNVCTGPIETQVTACSGDSGGPIIQPFDDVSSLNFLCFKHCETFPICSPRSLESLHGFHISLVAQSTLSLCTFALQLLSIGLRIGQARCN